MEFDFKDVNMENASALYPFLNGVSSALSDFTPGAVALWAEYFSGAYCRVGNSYILRSDTPWGAVSFFTPLKNADPSALTDLRRYAAEKYGRFALYPLDDAMLKQAEDVLGAPAAVKSAPDYFDYVYAIDDLIELRGKKYHGQRNHVNKFALSYSDIKVRDITPENAAPIIEFIRGIGAGDGGGTAAYEAGAIVRALENFRGVGLLGIFVEAEGKIVGFTMGGIKGDTLFTHIEKADRTFSGAYNFLTNAFAKRMKELNPGLAYVNREEDLGDEGLRAAKRSWHPVALLKKHFATWK